MLTIITLFVQNVSYSDVYCLIFLPFCDPYIALDVGYIVVQLFWLFTSEKSVEGDL
jgi:hypothetical protein